MSDISALHVVASINVDTGGPAVSVPRLAESIAKAGGSVRLVALDYPALGAHFSSAIEEKRIVPTGRIARGLRGFSVAVSAAIEKSARLSNLVHNHGLWMGPNTFARMSAVRNGLPLVISPRGMLEPWAKRRSAITKRIAWKLYERSNLAACQLFHATSQQECESIRAAGFRQPIAVIPNGVEVTNASGHQRGRRVLFLGRLHPVKGVDDLLLAWASLSSERDGWELVIAGPDPGGYGVALRRSIKRLGIGDSVHLVGPLDGNAKRDAFAAASLLVLPSRSESFGLVVAEALAAGTPVITTTATPWGRIEEKGCGWVVEPNLGALHGSLRRALALTARQRAAMGAAGIAWMRAEFAWDAIGRRMLSAYRWLIVGGEAPDDVHVT